MIHSQECQWYLKWALRTPTLLDTILGIFHLIFTLTLTTLWDRYSVYSFFTKEETETQMFTCPRSYPDVNRIQIQFGFGFNFCFRAFNYYAQIVWVIPTSRLKGQKLNRDIFQLLHYPLCVNCQAFPCIYSNKWDLNVKKNKKKK